MQSDRSHKFKFSFVNGSDKLISIFIELKKGNGERHDEIRLGKGRQKLIKLLEKYTNHKMEFAKNIKFESKLPGLSK